jgi:hypothetical protein
LANFDFGFLLVLSQMGLEEQEELLASAKGVMHCLEYLVGWWTLLSILRTSLVSSLELRIGLVESKKCSFGVLKRLLSLRFG